MSKWCRRFISFVMSIMALSLSLGLSTAPAQAATSLYVDNNLPLCKAGAYPTIQAAVTAAGAGPAKITVCPGTYPVGAVTILGGNKIKLIAKPGVTLVPAITPFSFPLINVYNSTNVTVQGFTVDGLGSLSPSLTPAIYYFQSSGTISKNTVVNWNTPTYPADRWGIGIQVDGTNGGVVKIDRNTITNADSMGIFVDGPAPVKITKNTITASVSIIASAIGIFCFNGTTGIVSGNRISSDAFPSGAAFDGISLSAVSGMKITGNTVTGALYGIRIGAGDTQANNNIVSRNKILEAFFGIEIRATTFGVDGHADNNKVTGNKITNTLELGLMGISVIAPAPTASFALNNTVKGNTITHFEIGVAPLAGTGSQVTGTFQPNKVKP